MKTDGGSINHSSQMGACLRLIDPRRSEDGRYAIGSEKELLRLANVDRGLQR